MRLAPPTIQRLRTIATTSAVVFTGALAMAQADVNVAQYLSGKTLRKTIFVKGRLLNLVVG